MILSEVKDIAIKGLFCVGIAFILSVLHSGCTRRVEEQDRGNEAISALFSSPQTLQLVDFDEFEVEFFGGLSSFKKSDGSAEELRTALLAANMAATEGSHPKSPRKTVGTIKVVLGPSYRSYQLFRSDTDNRLLILAQPQTRSAGSSLICFLDSDEFRNLLTRHKRK
jgi:hypothetical protein